MWWLYNRKQQVLCCQILISHRLHDLICRMKHSRQLLADTQLILSRQCWQWYKHRIQWISNCGQWDTRLLYDLNYISLFVCQQRYHQVYDVDLTVLAIQCKIMCGLDSLWSLVSVMFKIHGWIYKDKSTTFSRYREFDIWYYGVTNMLQIFDLYSVDRYCSIKSGWLYTLSIRNQIQKKDKMSSISCLMWLLYLVCNLGFLPFWR